MFKSLNYFSCVASWKLASLNTLVGRLISVPHTPQDDKALYTKQVHKILDVEKKGSRISKNSVQKFELLFIFIFLEVRSCQITLVERFILVPQVPLEDKALSGKQVHKIFVVWKKKFKIL